MFMIKEKYAIIKNQPLAMVLSNNIDSHYFLFSENNQLSFIQDSTILCILLDNIQIDDILIRL